MAGKDKRALRQIRWTALLGMKPAMLSDSWWGSGNCKDKVSRGGDEDDDMVMIYIVEELFFIIFDCMQI